MKTKVFIKFPSHRQRDKAMRALGFKFQFYSFSRSTGYGCVRASQNEIARLKAEGISFSKMRAPYDDIRHCLCERWLDRRKRNDILRGTD